MDLSLDFSNHKDGVFVIHERVKQRTYKQFSKFLVPRGSTGKTDWAKILETFLPKVQHDLQKFRN